MIDKKWLLIFIAWIVSLVATLGSLFFSNIMKLPPCALCWYQRICMYPLVLILLTGLVWFDKNVIKFSGPLALTGLFLAVYHNLLYYKIIPASLSPCVQGISCTAVQINWFGFLTIPLMSLLAFTIIVSLLFLTQRIFTREK